MWLNFSVRYLRKQFSPWGKSPTTFANHDANYTVDAHAVCDLGINMERFIAKNVTVRFHVYNLFNADYRQGGSVNLPYEQPGRWFLAQVSYRFQ